MRIATVKSTTLATVGYDEAGELLQLEFCSRAVYLYFGVPAVVHQALLGARSKGRYFNRTIRGQFPFCLVPDGEAVPSNAAVPGGCHR